jgi:signal transduction histidine kinase
MDRIEDATDARGPVRRGIGRFRPTDATRITGDPEDTLTHLLRLTTAVLDRPIAYVALLDGQRLMIVSHEGLSGSAPASELARARSLAALAIDRRAPVLANDPDSLVGTVELDLLGEVALAAVPLEMPDGELIGTLCAAGPARAWDGRDAELLGHLAAAVTLVLRNREAIHASDAMGDLLRRMTQPIGELADQVRRLTVAASDVQDARVRAFAALTEERIKAVDGLTAEIAAATRAARGRPPAGDQAVDLVELVRRSLASARAAAGSKQAFLDSPPDELRFSGDALELEESLTALVLALMHYAGPEGEVRVRLGRRARGIRLDIVKLGNPIPAAELARMIGRFRTTGRESLTTLDLVGERVTVSAGSVKARSSARGTAFRVTLPAG